MDSKNVKDMKDERITIKFTKEEKRQIEEGAKERGINLSTYLRRKIFPEKYPELPASFVRTYMEMEDSMKKIIGLAKEILRRHDPKDEDDLDLMRDTMSLIQENSKTEIRILTLIEEMRGGEKNHGNIETAPNQGEPDGEKPE